MSFLTIMIKAFNLNISIYDSINRVEDDVEFTTISFMSDVDFFSANYSASPDWEKCILVIYYIRG